MDISIIVPIYNSERHLLKCLDSIFNQDFDGFYEIILINDGSTDDSHLICESFVSNNQQNVAYVDLEKNHGVSYARNRGLQIATGDYFTFVDADDILSSGALQNLHNAAKRFDADVVVGGYSKFKEGDLVKSYNTKKEIHLKRDKIVNTLLRHKKIKGHVWGKLFKKKSNLIFHEDIHYAEDLIFSMEYFLKSDSMVQIPTLVYQYHQNRHGASFNKYKRSLYEDWFKAIQLIDELANSVSYRKGYFRFRMKTILMVISDLRYIEESESKKIFPFIEKKVREWKITFQSLLAYKLFLPRDIFMLSKVKLFIWSRKIFINNYKLGANHEFK